VRREEFEYHSINLRCLALAKRRSFVSSRPMPHASRLLLMSDLDRELLARCLEKRQRGWEDFVDRFLGLVLHVIDHTTLMREIHLGRDDRDTLCEKVFAAIAHDDFRLLRNYQGRSSLSTYLTTVVRRVVVRILLNYSFLGYERRTA